MRSVRIVLFVCFLLIVIPARTQQTLQSQSAASAQGVVLLQQALRAIRGTTAISDVTLNGTARRIAGSDDETGTVVLEALATGQSRINAAYPSGQRSELTSISPAGVLTGNWTGPDGGKHSVSQHNLVTDSSWFYPGLTLTKLAASQVAVITLVGQESLNGNSVAHLVATQQFPDVPTDMVPLMQHVSRMDLFLDSKTLLPAVLGFNVNPDRDMLLDIPVEIRFSDYRALGGVQVPFHVQRYLNNSLILDIQLQTAVLNTGLAPSAFAVQ